MTRTLTTQELKSKKEKNSDLKIVNVLSQESFEKKHIPDSINIPLDELHQEAPKRLDKDEEIVVYCADFDCKASSKAAKKLEEMRYEKIFDFEGGVDNWEKSGFPLVESN